MRRYGAMGNMVACGVRQRSQRADNRAMAPRDERRSHRERLQAGAAAQPMASRLGARRDSTRTLENAGGYLAGLRWPYLSPSPTQSDGLIDCRVPMETHR